MCVDDVSFGTTREYHDKKPSHLKSAINHDNVKKNETFFNISLATLPNIFVVNPYTFFYVLFCVFFVFL